MYTFFIAVAILILILVVVPAILWLIPKCRKSKNGFLAALKTAPLGVLFIFLVMNCPGIPLPVAALAIPIGIALIILLGVYCVKKYQVNWKHLMIASPVIFILLFIVTVLSYLTAALAFALANPYRVQDWIDHELPFESAGGGKLYFRQRSIHAFLAEYDYQLQFKSPGRTVEKYLITNTGGKTLINVFRLPNGNLILEDKSGVYLVSANPFRTELIFEHNSKLYRAELPGEYITSWGPSVDDDQISFWVNDKKYPAREIKNDLYGGKYIGCIWHDGKFYPASEKPEKNLPFAPPESCEVHRYLRDNMIFYFDYPRRRQRYN